MQSLDPEEFRLLTLSVACTLHHLPPRLGRNRFNIVAQYALDSPTVVADINQPFLDHVELAYQVVKNNCTVDGV
jgi:hypothetical protein